MSKDLRDLVAKIEDIEPRVFDGAGPRELTTALIETASTVGDVLGNLESRLDRLEEKLDTNNQLLHNMVNVFDAFLSRDEPSETTPDTV